MGSSISHSPQRFIVYVHTKNGAIFRMSYLDLADHILLLRQVISHSHVMKVEKNVNHFIQEYCRRMAHKELTSNNQQLNLPWQIEWIWHVHRLHPVAYFNDCKTQFPGGYFVDKRVRNLKGYHQPYNFDVKTKINATSFKFAPSIDLLNAVNCQWNFLNKFKEHNLYKQNLKQVDMLAFEQNVQNYLSFLKLAEKNTIIVPTFDIDIIWHTHMRYPSSYFEMSTNLCGFLLDHNDSMTKESLVFSYQETAKRWKTRYKSDYGENINRHNLITTQYLSSCATIYKTDNSQYTNSSSSCGGQWTWGWESDGTDGSGDGGSCGGGCGGD